MPNLVVDPVMVAASGAALVEGNARHAYLELISHAVVVTPNLDEAEVLVGHDVRDEDEMARAAKELHALGRAPSSSRAVTAKNAMPPTRSSSEMAT